MAPPKSGLSRFVDDDEDVKFILGGSGELVEPPPEDADDPDPLPDLSGYDLGRLLELRNAIHERLPARDLGEIDLNKELVLQLQATQALQTRVLADKNTPANQKAQVANSVASILQQLAKTQSEIYTSERLKRIENCIVDMMKTMPEEQQRTFFERYEAALSER